MKRTFELLMVCLFALWGCDGEPRVASCGGLICSGTQRCDDAQEQCVGDCDRVQCDPGLICDPVTGMCEQLPEEVGEALCADGVDNDGDGVTDCADPGCAPLCALDPEEGDVACSDGLDNDGDGQVDCADEGCQLTAPLCSGPEPNGGWIGSFCASGEACQYANAMCITEEPFGGMCSALCELYCPDSSEEGYAGTFCVTDPSQEGQGICVARCDGQLFPETGCREGYTCAELSRHTQPSVVQSVCLPPALVPEICSASDVPQPNAGVVAPPGSGGCPDGMGTIDGGLVCMDFWEAHLVEVLAPGVYQPHSPYFNPGSKVVMAVSAPDAVPQGYITQVQALAACAQAGKRLCTDDEWLLACRTSAQNIYPYGNTREPGWCNDARATHPVVEYFGTSDSWIWSELDHPCINQLHDSLQLTGTNPQCVTPEGFFDLMGNLHEWTADPEGTFRGGYYVDTVINGEGCLYRTTAHSVSHYDYSTGFRCCADR